MPTGKAGQDLWRVGCWLQREHFVLPPGLSKGGRTEQTQRDGADREGGRGKREGEGERETDRQTQWLGERSAAQLTLWDIKDAREDLKWGLLSHGKSPWCSG